MRCSIWSYLNQTGNGHGPKPTLDTQTIQPIACPKAAIGADCSILGQLDDWYADLVTITVESQMWIDKLCE